jgi:hypothetical protein
VQSRRRSGAIAMTVVSFGLSLGLAACSSGSSNTLAGVTSPSTTATSAVASTTVTGSASAPAAPSSVPAANAPAVTPSGNAGVGSEGAGNAPTGPNDLPAFVGTWTGHDRTLTINANGIATETVYDGCCTIAWTLRFSVDHVSGTHANAAVYTTLLAADFKENPNFPNVGSPEAQVGQGGIGDVQDGVLTEVYTGTTFCDPTADAANKCGE